MRFLTDHKSGSGLNESVTIGVIDDHNYQITVGTNPPWILRFPTSADQVAANGMTKSGLLAILIDREKTLLAATPVHDEQMCLDRAYESLMWIERGIRESIAQAALPPG